MVGQLLLFLLVLVLLFFLQQFGSKSVLFVPFSLPVPVEFLFDEQLLDQSLLDLSFAPQSVGLELG